MHVVLYDFDQSKVGMFDQATVSGERWNDDIFKVSRSCGSMSLDIVIEQLIAMLEIIIIPIDT